MARVLLEDSTFEVKETDLDLDIAPDPDAVYVLRSLTVAKAREIGKKHTRQEFDRSQHRKVDVVDAEAVNDAIIDHILADWRGVGSDGKAPCTKENKLKLPVPVQKALLERAQVGDSAEVRAASFRQPA
jgi:hypothetical protein